MLELIKYDRQRLFRFCFKSVLKINYTLNGIYKYLISLKGNAENSAAMILWNSRIR